MSELEKQCKDLIFYFDLTFTNLIGKLYDGVHFLENRINGITLIINYKQGEILNYFIEFRNSSLNNINFF